MAPVALAFAVLDLPNGNATLLGTILGINTVALLIMFPFGGVIADRYGRAKWIAYGDVLTALLLFFQVSFFATGNVPFWVFCRSQCWMRFTSWNLVASFQWCLAGTSARTSASEGECAQ